MYRKRKDEERKAQEKRKKARVRRRALKERDRHRHRKQKDKAKAKVPQELDSSEEWEERKYLLAQRQAEALRLLRVLLRKISVRLFPNCSSILVGTNLSETQPLHLSSGLWQTDSVKDSWHLLGFALNRLVSKNPNCGLTGWIATPSLKELGLNSTIQHIKFVFLNSRAGSLGTI